jgi:hypothetical protein
MLVLVIVKLARIIQAVSVLFYVDMPVPFSVRLLS